MWGNVPANIKINTNGIINFTAWNELIIMWYLIYKQSTYLGISDILSLYTMLLSIKEDKTYVPKTVFWQCFPWSATCVAKNQTKNYVLAYSENKFPWSISLMYHVPEGHQLQQMHQGAIKYKIVLYPQGNISISLSHYSISERVIPAKNYSRPSGKLMEEAQNITA